MALVRPSAPDREPESTWLLRIRAGEESAFAALFRAHCRSLCDFVRSHVRNPEVAEEIVQDVFLRIWARHATWNPTNGIRAYLFGACHNAALNHLEHERVAARAAENAVREHSTPGLGARAPAPDAGVEASELAAALRRAVHDLPERRRLVVILRWQHHLRFAEIARVLDISERGAETQFARAMAALRGCLSAFRK